MFISSNWLQQYIPKGIPSDKTKLRERVSFSLAEVEQVIRIGNKISNVVVGEIKKIDKHPNTENLNVVLVSIGEKEDKTIVCGAENLKIKAKVPVALPGGKVLHPKQKLHKQEAVEIKEAKIKGVKSEGMICSQKELGLSDDHTQIWILSEGAEVGDKLKEIIEDDILEIENKSLTHRPDCFSHIGIAREMSAILKTDFKTSESKITLKPTQDLPLEVQVKNNDLCKRYTAITIQGVKVKASPLWLQKRLLSVGVKPVNNVVDATNYVMLDMGQPLHAFDYDKIDSKKIIVRGSKNKEELTTLDGELRELGKDHVLITDSSKTIALGGIMGGVNTEIEKETENIVIESANFEMFNLRRTTRELGLRTEASARFEKGLDPNLTKSALKKAVELILELAGGEISSEVIDIYPEVVEEEFIDFDIKDIPRLLGVEIQKDNVIEMLKSLQLEVEDENPTNTKIKITVPTFRQDLHIKEDIVEEVARIYGYDKFTPTLPEKTLKPAPLNYKREFDKLLKQTLGSLGYSEIYTYSFVGESLYNDTLLDISNCIKLKNPISPDLEYLRNDLIPNILEKIIFNLSNFSDIKMFEVSKVIHKELNDDNLPQQPKKIALALTSQKEGEQLFMEMKGALAELFEKINLENKTKYQKTTKFNYLHPYINAEITSDQKILGHIGLIHPKVLKNLKTDQKIAVAQLDFETLHQLSTRDNNYKKVVKFPTVERDFSFWFDKNVSISQIKESLEKANINELKNLKIIDIFKKEEKKSIAIRVVLQSETNTLKQEEIKDITEIIVKSVEKAGGNLRKK